MRTMLVAIGLVIAGAANAKPLPPGMKVILKLGRPYIQQGGVTVALRDDDLADYEKVVKAELAADGKTLQVTAARCGGTLPDDQVSVPLAQVQARIDNALGLVAHGKKKYADAIKKLSSAVAKDPETPAYATNLLAAQLLGKKTVQAAQTIAVHGKRNPVWFGWRMVVDPDLNSAQALKSAQGLLANTAGLASVAKLGGADIAISDLAGGIAALRTLSVGSPGTSEIDFVSLTSGKLLARIPLVTIEDACDETADHPCDDAAKARITERVKLVNALFASQGFQITANAFVDVRNGDPMTKDGVHVEISDDKLSATRGDAGASLEVHGSVWSVAVLPKAVVAKVNRRNIYACNDGSSRFVGLALPLR